MGSTCRNNRAAPACTLLGCVHLDPDGPRRLSCALEALRPDLVTVEISPFGIRFRKLHGRRLLKLLESRLGALRHERLEAERRRAEEMRRELVLEIERERAAALERAARQRKELNLEVESPR